MFAIRFLAGHRLEIGGAICEPFVARSLARGLEWGAAGGRSGRGLGALLHSTDATGAREEFGDVFSPSAGRRAHAAGFDGIGEQRLHALQLGAQVEQSMPDGVHARQIAVGESGRFVGRKRLDETWGDDAIKPNRQGKLIRRVQQFAHQRDEGGIGGFLEGGRLDLAEAEIKGIHLQGIFPESATHLALELERRRLRQPAGEDMHALMQDEAIAIQQPAVGIDVDRLGRRPAGRA